MKSKTTAIRAIKQEIRLQEWSAQVKAQQASGMTVRQWCTENVIKPATYYYRLRLLRASCIKKTPVIVPLTVPQTSSAIHIEKNGLQISLPADMDPEILLALVRELCLRDLTTETQVYLVTSYTDLRRSIDGLAEITQGQLHLNPFSQELFLFCG